jgi:hypothetical protein
MVAAAFGGERGALWGELGALAAERERLDDRELALIDQARREGATWSQIAAALGLASRQAAEQRRQRLDRSLRARQREIDSRYGDPIPELRAAVSGLCTAIRADRSWESRFVRAALVRDTLTTAATADPGPLFALAAQAAADLGQSGVEVLPGPVRDGVIELRRALKDAIPASTSH